MSAPSVTYTFANSTLADATQVNTNFANLVSGSSDGTKDYSINALTVAGTATLNGNVTLGNATGDDISITGSIAASIVLKTDATYSFGSVTAGLVALYLNNGVTDSGSICFDGSASKYIKGNAAGTELAISGMTNLKIDGMSHEVYNSTTMRKVDSSGVLIYGGSSTAGWTSNLGIKYTSGTGVFEMVGYDGTAISSSNPAHITVPSKTAGTLKTFKLTTGDNFIDDNGASEIINNLFGLTTGRAHANAIPFFIYAVINDAETAVSFALSRIPHALKSPAIADIGCPGTASADVAESFFFMESITVANYDDNPCICLGSIQMTMSALDDWTVTAISNVLCGIGKFQDNEIFSMSAGHFGASASKLAADNGGTFPAWTTSTIQYKIHRSGLVTVYVCFTGDAGTDGSGAVASKFPMPLPMDSRLTASGVNITMGAINYSVAGGATAGIGQAMTTSGSTWTLMKSDGVSNLAWSDITNGARTISGSFFYDSDYYN